MVCHTAHTHATARATLARLIRWGGAAGCDSMSNTTVYVEVHRAVVGVVFEHAVSRDGDIVCMIELEHANH